MIKTINLLSLSILPFLSACVPNETVETTIPKVVLVESSVENSTQLGNQSLENKSLLTEDNLYGIYTADIKNLLEASPIGSEIYLKEEGNGEWHIRIEKIFTAESFSSESAKYFEDKVIDEENSEIISESNVHTPEILSI